MQWQTDSRVRRLQQGTSEKDWGTCMKRWLCAVPLAIPLFGCGLPPAVTVASLVLDVASFSATGKTVTDHGLSFAFDRDCAMLYALEDGGLCRNTAALAELSPLTDPQAAPDQGPNLLALKYLTDLMSARQIAALR